MNGPRVIAKLHEIKFGNNIKLAQGNKRSNFNQYLHFQTLFKQNLARYTYRTLHWLVWLTNQNMEKSCLCRFNAG